MPVSLFVYGTLKRGAPGEQRRLLRGARFVRNGSVSGTLYDLGRYPGLVRTAGSGRRVLGEVYELPEDTATDMLRDLDRYEGHEFARRRVYVTLSDGRRRAAWAYVLKGRVPKSARHLESGRYSGKRGAIWEDAIVAEVRAAREKIAARFDHDVGRIVDHFVAVDRKRGKSAKQRPRTSKAKAK